MLRGVFLIFLFLMLAPFSMQAQTYYWVGFTDKSGSPYSINNPSEYLSERAILRRQKQGISIDETDLPVKREYINQVLGLGATYIHSSKWLNGVTVQCDSADFAEQVSAFSFVREVQVTKRNLTSTKSLKNKFHEPGYGKVETAIDTSYYGPSVYQVGMLNGQYLHEQNYLGQEMQIAVLDAGFYRANELQAFDSLWINGQILGTHDFVNPDSDIFQEHYHGMTVLSTMGGNMPGVLIGTAPKASFWLIRSEDALSEFIIEEDNWAAAAEFADSVGVDVINSSLGYSTFDDAETNHTYTDMDGQTTRVSRAADIAASRGILVVTSAGNEGNDPWRYILAPADGDSVLAVAAVDRDRAPAFFTSHGPASDGDVKPNVAALGLYTVLASSSGTLTYGSGTSYSSPLMAGMAACLWQANPEASASQVKNAIEKSADLYNSPDTLLGYGIPDFEIADRILKFSLAASKESKWWIYPNPAQNSFSIFQKGELIPGELNITLFDITGRVLGSKVLPSAMTNVVEGIANWPAGVLFLRIDSEEGAETLKLVKSH